MVGGGSVAFLAGGGLLVFGFLRRKAATSTGSKRPTPPRG